MECRNHAPIGAKLAALLAGAIAISGCESMGNGSVGKVLVGAVAGAALGAAVAGNSDDLAVQELGTRTSRQSGAIITVGGGAIITVGNNDKMVQSVLAGAAIGALVGMLVGKDATEAMGGQAQEVPTAAQTSRSARLRREAEQREAQEGTAQVFLRARVEQHFQEAIEAQAAQSLEERKARDAAEIAATVSANF